ncbi:MAG: crosslink repair DNA glycosylase YcaQ family protein [Thermomicrobiales bacterium]
MLELSIKQARRLMIGAQQLDGPPPKRPTKKRMLETIRQLGVLQIDSISVVERSHHLVLWSRLGNHPTEWLYELHGEDRELFEYWAHACAYTPIELFGPFRRRMLDHERLRSKRAEEWIAENQEVLDRVVAFVRENGAVSTRSFDPPPGAKKAEAWAWYGNKPTNLALDILWTDGTLMIDRREGFQRFYDLTERVHPEWIDEEHLPTEQEALDQIAARTLQALGVATAAWLPDYFRSNSSSGLVPRRQAAEVRDRLVELDLAVPARVKGLDDEVIVWKELLDKRIRPSRTTLLSPFDSLIWDRRRAVELFDYQVKFEVYVPRAKRQYGYFNLAILHRDELVGQLDPKVHRKERLLTINSLHLEPHFIGRDDDRFYASLAETLRDFMAFNGADEIEVKWSDPEEAAGRLQTALTP